MFEARSAGTSGPHDLPEVCGAPPRSIQRAAGVGVRRDVRDAGSGGIRGGSSRREPREPVRGCFKGGESRPQPRWEIRTGRATPDGSPGRIPSRTDPLSEGVATFEPLGVVIAVGRARAAIMSLLLIHAICRTRPRVRYGPLRPLPAPETSYRGSLVSRIAVQCGVKHAKSHRETQSTADYRVNTP